MSGGGEGGHRDRNRETDCFPSGFESVCIPVLGFCDRYPNPYNILPFVC